MHFTTSITLNANCPVKKAVKGTMVDDDDDSFNQGGGGGGAAAATAATTAAAAAQSTSCASGASAAASQTSSISRRPPPEETSAAEEEAQPHEPTTTVNEQDQQDQQHQSMTTSVSRVTDDMNETDSNNSDNDDDKEHKEADRHDDDDADADDGGWTPLMGEDLVMKTIRFQDSNNDNDDNIAVQPQDVARIDFVGRLAPTKKDASGSSSNSQPQPQNSFPVFQKATNWVIAIGAKDVVPAIEMGVRFMKVGQTALVWSNSKYAYGFGTRRYQHHHHHHHHPGNDDDDGNENEKDASNDNDASFYELPPNSNVCFEITVHHVYTDEECQEANFAIFLAQSRKAIANNVYAQEWQEQEQPQQDSTSSSLSAAALGGQGKQRAIYLYQKVAKDLLQVVQEEEESADNDDNSTKTTTRRRDEALAILLDCLNNIVAVHLRAKEYHAAKLAAVQVLQMDPNNIKALIRAAKSSLFDPASSYQEVHASLQAATERLYVLLRSDNNKNDSNISSLDAEKETAELKKHQADLRRLKADFTKRQQEYKQKSKAMFSKALGSNDTNKTTTTPAATSTSAPDKLIASQKDSNNNVNRQDVTNEFPADTIWYKKLPWRSHLLPLMFQMMLPFIMWYFVHYYRRPNDASIDIATATAAKSMSIDRDGSGSGTSDEF